MQGLRLKEYASKIALDVGFPRNFERQISTDECVNIVNQVLPVLLQETDFSLDHISEDYQGKRKRDQQQVNQRTG